MINTWFGFKLIRLDGDYKCGEPVRIGWFLFSVVAKFGHWYLLKQFSNSFERNTSFA